MQAYSEGIIDLFELGDVKVLRPSGMSFFVYSLHVRQITNETYMYTVNVTPNRTPCAVAAATVLSTSSTRVRGIT